MKVKGFRLCIMLIVGMAVTVGMPSISSATCYLWSGNGYASLKAALDNNACVQIDQGIHTIEQQIYIPAGRTLTGKGSTVSTLAPSQDIGNLSVIAIASSNVTLSNFRLTGELNGIGNKAADLGIAVVPSQSGAATTGVVIDSMQVDGVRCDGVTIQGIQTILRYSVLTNNGGQCYPQYGWYGSAIYTVVYSQYDLAPQIYGNNIYYNAGTGLDIAQVNNGYLGNNSIWDNGGLGGVVIYESHGWTIENNLINNSGGNKYYGHPACEWGGDNTGKTVGILLCCDQDYYDCAAYNTVRNNSSQGYIGILLIGADEVQPYEVPRFNTITGNNVYGSVIGCADDFVPGQWVDGNNLWSNNNCAGTSNTPPAFF